jgi:acyl-CoA synthetase (AMP-forming)/AMP-acid ligase II
MPVPAEHSEPAVAVSGSFETIAELMDAAVEQIGDWEGIVDGDRRLTFARWVRSADGVARLFADAGVGRGDVVALHLGNGIEYAVAYAAAARLAAVTTGINLRLGPSEVGSIIERCNPKIYVTEPEAPVPPELSSSATVITSDDLAIAAEGPPIIDWPAAEGSDPVCIIWTSGTTGVPKGAWFDHRGSTSPWDLAWCCRQRRGRRSRCST